MPPQASRSAFKLGINMAGAVSAGAYTAGVLDFLIEALEEWEAAKSAFRDSLARPSGSVPTSAGSAPPPVPLHDVSIDVFGGASAGGMCAAIASVMVQQNFVHIRTATETSTNNTFYESWVNQIDIRPLLGTSDVEGGRPVVSILDSSIVDSIAAAALTPAATLQPRPYVSPSLTLLLALTNVRGVPYALYNDPAPTVDEFTVYYGDRLRFETTQGDAAPTSPTAKPLPAGLAGQGAWPLLREAAKATGAFPLFLAPRVLNRDKADYQIPLWRPLCESNSAEPVPPALPPAPPPTWQTLNIDGGVTNNSPFQLVENYLACRNPLAHNCENPSGPLEANCAVVTVAPFPAVEKYDDAYDPAAESGIFTMIGRLFAVLVSQSRFLGESAASLTSGVSFSRFVIAPSDPARASASPLQCGLLNAFGGFFERGFRAHDFLMGRRNCQKFLMTHFCLPLENPVIAAGLADAGIYSSDIQARFSIDAPNGTVQPQGKHWMPLIPLVGSARQEVPAPSRAKISSDSIDEIIGLIVNRGKALKPQLLDGAPLALRALASIALSWPVSGIIKGKLREMLYARLAGNIAQ